MAIIHGTTLTPKKLELLAAWLPGRPWYQGGRVLPRLTRAGGFRLDDPQGEVGLALGHVTGEWSGGGVSPSRGHFITLRVP